MWPSAVATPLRNGSAADEAVVGQQVGAVGEMLARAEADFEVQRPVVAEQARRVDLALRRHRDLRQQRVDQLLLALAQLVPARPAVEPVERGRVAGLVRGHRAAPMRSSCRSASRREDAAMKKASCLLPLRTCLRDARSCDRRARLPHRRREPDRGVGRLRPCAGRAADRERRLIDNGRNVPVQGAAMVARRRTKLRLLLTDPSAHAARAAASSARRNGHIYDGSLWRGWQAPLGPLPRRLEP